MKEWEETKSGPPTTRASSKWEGDDSGCIGKNKTGHPQRKNVVRQRSSVLIWAKVCVHLEEKLARTRTDWRNMARLATHTWMASKTLTGAGEKRNEEGQAHHAEICSAGGSDRRPLRRRVDEGRKTLGISSDGKQLLVRRPTREPHHPLHEGSTTGLPSTLVKQESVQSSEDAGIRSFEPNSPLLNISPEEAMRTAPPVAQKFDRLRESGQQDRL